MALRMLVIALLVLGSGFILRMAWEEVAEPTTLAQAQQPSSGPPADTPAPGTDTNGDTTRDIATIAANNCRVSPGASVTLSDYDGTRARFVDGRLGINITATENELTIQGPPDESLEQNAVEKFPDTSFFNDGDWTVVTTTGIACEGGGTTPDEPPATEDLDGDESLEGDDTTAADNQYDATTGDTTTTAKDGIPSEKKIIDVPKQKVLIDTGGPPLLLLGAALMCLAGAAIAGQLLRVLRR
jgi:hypothetical protein